MAIPKGLTFEDAPFERLLAYGGVDVIATYDILRKMWPQLSARPEYREFYGEGKVREVRAPSILSELIHVKAKALEFIVNMEVDGIPYDVDGNQKMGVLMAEEIATLEDEIFTGIGQRINLNSGQEVAHLLYTVYGMECPVKTKGGEESTSGDALAKLVEQYDYSWLKALDRRKNVNSVYNSFIKTYIEDFVKSDGCIHPEYNLHGTSSHRISSDNPNLLNLPRPDSCPPYDIRSLYIVRKGFVFLTLDFSSCEVKVLAARCRDERMLKAIRDGLDFHTYTASIINGLTYEEMSDVLGSTKAQLAADANRAKLFKRYKKLRQAAKAVTLNS